MKSETATFALGCFWKPEDYFIKVPGVTTTTVGYSGGTIKNPTYENLGDHTETVQIEFDPSLVSYKKLLDKFWKLHDPSVTQSKQYSSFIFTNSEDQAEEAKLSAEAYAKISGKILLTKILNAEKFYRAEEYHQKYLEKARGAT